LGLPKLLMLCQTLGILGWRKQEERKPHNQNFKTVPGWMISLFIFNRIKIGTIEVLDLKNISYQVSQHQHPKNGKKLIRLSLC